MGEEIKVVESDADPLEQTFLLVDELEDASEVKALRSILKDAVPQLGMAELAILEEFLKDRTGFSQRTVSALVKEAREYVEGHRYIHTVDDAVKAYTRMLEANTPAIVSSGSGLYTYDPSTGTFDFDKSDDVEKHLITTFGGVSLMQREAAIRLVLKRVCLHYADESYFSDARAGVNLRDGFLGITAEGRPDLLPHSPDHKARTCIDVAYKPSASFDWLEAALRRSLPSQAALDALQEIVGAITFNVRPTRDSVRRMFVLHGARNSGKSTIINLLLDLLPAGCVGSVPPGHWGDPNYRANLEDILLNFVTELGGNTRIGGENMKKIVSCEPIIVRRMRRDPVTITPRAWHLFATNELPRIVDKTDAFERRLLVITFPRSLDPSEVDGTFMDKIRADPNAVLHWAAAGAARLLQNGTFTMPDGHTMAVAEMQFGDDWPMIFAHTQVRQSPSARVTTTELRSALFAFAADRGVDVEKVENIVIRRVSDVLKAKYGATRRKTNGKPFYDGVSLVPHIEPATHGSHDVNLDEL